MANSILVRNRREVLSKDGVERIDFVALDVPRRPESRFTAKKGATY